MASSMRRCQMCDEVTPHTVEEREDAGVATLLFTCEGCWTMTVRAVEMEAEDRGAWGIEPGSPVSMVSEDR